MPELQSRLHMWMVGRSGTERCRRKQMANESGPKAGGHNDRCDAHFHVFGPASAYPVIPEVRYAAPLATFEDYTAHVRALDIARFVFVQPSAYGRDNSCMLDAMRRSEERRV